MVDEELKQKAEEGIKKLAKDIERNKLIDSFVKIIPFAFVLIVGFLLGTVVVSFNHQDSVSIPNECFLRNTPAIHWYPSMVTQMDANGNVVGIPICMPFDVKTGQRIKNS